MGYIEVLTPGMLTTVQDQGRLGHQQSGVCVSGVMDSFAHRVANILCGNADQNEAVLEVSMTGPTLKFHGSAYIAITGADLSPAIDGTPVKTWQSAVIKRGETLSFREIVAGAHAYIAIFGGLDIPALMGSKSTSVKAKIGGFGGRALQKGDKIPYKTTGVSGKQRLQLPQPYIPVYERESTLRAVLGPQDDAFTQEGIETFLSASYKVTNQVDRMGYRLEGRPIIHKDSGDIISDGTAMGTVQVPGQGQPIILMADRQTTGGYAKIATVISADLYKVAQAKPGDILRFSAISIEQAQEIYRDWQRRFKLIADSLLPVDKDKAVMHYNVYINGKAYPVTIRET